MSNPLDVLLIADEIPPATTGRAHLLGELLSRQPAAGTYVLAAGRGGAKALPGAAAPRVHRLPGLLARLGGSWAREKHLDWVTKNRPPQMCVAFGLGAEARLARLLNENREVPYMLHLEGPEIVRARRAIRERTPDAAATAALLESAASVVTSSQACRLEAYKAGVLPHQLDVIAPGVDLRRFSPGPPPKELAKKLKVDRGPVLLSVIGRGATRDLETLFRTFASVRGQIKQATLLLVGVEEGEERKLLKKLRVERHVRYLHNVSGTEMPDVYRLASAFVTTHRERPRDWVMSGIDLAVIEALATGLPIFGTHTPTLEEIAPSYEVGVLVEPEAHTKLGRVLVDVLKNDEDRAEWAAAARQRAEEQFSAEQNAASFRELLEVVWTRRLGRDRLVKSERDAA